MSFCRDVVPSPLLIVKPKVACLRTYHSELIRQEMLFVKRPRTTEMGVDIMVIIKRKLKYKSRNKLVTNVIDHE